MGGNFSEPIVNLNGEGYLCFVFRSHDKFRVLFGNAQIHQMVVALVREVAGDETADVVTEAKHGSVQFRLPGSPFSPTCGKESALMGKKFVLKLLENLYIRGYDYLNSADLSRAYDQGSLFFKQGLMSGERSPKSMIAIAPCGDDKLHLVNCTDGVVQTVVAAITSAWKPGLKTETQNEDFYQLKLRGRPWASESSDEALMARKVLLAIVGQLAESNWKFHAAVNIRNGCGNCLFFMHDERYAMTSQDFGVIAPGRWDRLRLVGFDQASFEAARLTVLRFHQNDPDDRYGSGVAEYKLKGYPFSCAADEAINARQLICRLLEALRDRGWQLLAGLDLAGKRSFEKSIFLMERCESARLKFACVAPADMDRLYLINFPHQISQLLKQTVTKYYLPGLVSETARDASSIHEIVLQGPPWSQNTSYNLHARTMLLMMIKDLAQYGWKLLACADATSKYVHHDNGVDYPIDVQSLYFCFNGVPKGVSVPNSASMVFDKGHEVLRCDPYAHVVISTTKESVCDSCMKTTEGGAVAFKKCGGCKVVYYCGLKCQKKAWASYHRSECTYIRKVSPNIPTDTVRLMARIIDKLKNRGGMREHADLPDGRQRYFEDLMTHQKEIVGDSKRIEAFLTFYRVLEECLGPDGLPPKSEVLDIYGRIMINSFNIMNEEYQPIGIGLYLAASVIDHSCEPNASVVFDGPQLVLRTIKPADSFADIRISYTNLLGLTKTRQTVLNEQYYFRCSCGKCQNAQSDTDKKAIRCPKCPGHMTEITPKCKACGHHDASLVQQYSKLAQQFEDIVLQNVNFHPEPEEECESFYLDMKSVFHPFDKKYLDLLEIVYEQRLAKGNYQATLEVGLEILMHYQHHYPKYDLNTGLMEIKIAKLLCLLDKVDEADQHYEKGKDILMVTHGPKHHLLAVTLPLVKQDIDMGRREAKDLKLLAKKWAKSG